ncbi:MAG TPA: MATE family efflux transporter [Roseiarcus sp.]|nr:MATE family efflux transporter [Roseiarcus sp.]
MSAVSAAPRVPRAVFTEGSTLRHVTVMTATGTVGLMAIFVVDLLSLFYVSRLGQEALKAAIGYASQVLFLSVAINIGLTIAISATTARALGAGDRPRAQQLAASGLVIAGIVAALVAATLFTLRGAILDHVMHAQEPARDVADKFLAITLPANVPFAIGMACSGLLRAVGDARRAMYVTLTGGLVTAFTDPLLIFGFGLGVYGAAWATVVSRLVFLSVGVYGAIYVHGLVGRPARKAMLRDFVPIMGIGGPAILANLATPAAAVYTTRVFSDFGEAAVAAVAITDRIIPVAFGVIFALTGSVGPVLSQNLGARLMGRVRRALTESFLLSVAYVLAAWALLFLATPFIVFAFKAQGDSARFLSFFCALGVSAWLFIACLFVANTAFNNLGFPVLATAFNWGRATLGTIPFVTIGAQRWGVEGGMMGAVAGSAVFGVAAVATAYWVTARLAERIKTA